jgi:hypothetical protein
MDQRIVDFIAALRAAGVRVSLAESVDALHAVEHVGVAEREPFRLALKTTLVKDAGDGPTYDSSRPISSSSCARRCASFRRASWPTCCAGCSRARISRLTSSKNMPAGPDCPRQPAVTSRLT